MDLGKHAVDLGIIDCDDRRAGKVDDLVIEAPEPDSQRQPELPIVSAIISGPLGLAAEWPSVVRWLARLWYRFLGLRDPAPSEIPWSHVRAIDVVVHLDIPREQAGWHALAQAVRRRYILRIPGA